LPPNLRAEVPLLLASWWVVASFSTEYTALCLDNRRSYGKHAGWRRGNGTKLVFRERSTALSSSSWFFSVPLSKCLDHTTIASFQILSSSSLIFDAIWSSY
jgi:hypothetical protein